MINPLDGIFCLKCCKGIKGCNISNWQQGCAGMVPGDYSVGFSSGPLPRTGRTVTVPPSNTSQATPSPTTPKSTGAAAKTSHLLMLLAMLY
jgi:hypothetical protein